MQNNMGTKLGMLATVLFLATSAHSQNPPAAPEQRELIYCADQMSHEEREAYRMKMRAARTAEEKAALRQAHQEEMRTRAKQRGSVEQCAPLQQRLRQGRGQ